jgi:hypothetical protein
MVFTTAVIYKSRSKGNVEDGKAKTWARQLRARDLKDYFVTTINHCKGSQNAGLSFHFQTKIRAITTIPHQHYSISVVLNNVRMQAAREIRFFD